MNYTIREIQRTDYDKGYINLLKQLTSVGSIKYSDFVKKVTDIINNVNHYIYVIEDNDKKEIIATGTIFIENKIIHNFGKVGHIEDIVVHRDYRGCNLGKIIVAKMVEIGKDKGCYKIILDCKETNIGFYEKCGFKKHQMQMASYL